MALPKDKLSSKPATEDREPIKSKKLKEFDLARAKGVNLAPPRKPKPEDGGGLTSQKIEVANDPYAKEKIKEWKKAKATIK